jgi:heme A synthase
MAEVHLVVGCALILLNLAAFAVGGIAWIREQASVPFWYLLRAAQGSVFLQALLGGLLVFTGHKPDSDLHYLYGILPLVVSFIAEGARAGAAERELRDIDIAALPP